MAFLVGYLIVLACLILYQADLGQVALALIAVTLVDLAAGVIRRRWQGTVAGHIRGSG
jgi:multisubunit Na+/H+ antiporter MnhB subunit